MPTQGSITLNGEPVASFGEDISEWIGVINQSPYLFHTTILNNLRIGNEEASEEEVWDVLKRVGLSEMVTALPEGCEPWLMKQGYVFPAVNAIGWH